MITKTTRLGESSGGLGQQSHDHKDNKQGETSRGMEQHLYDHENDEARRDMHARDLGGYRTTLT